MSNNEWLSSDDITHLKQCQAPLRYIRALGEIDHPPSDAKRFDYSERYGVFTYMSQRRYLRGAQAATFKIAEVLEPHLGKRRSIWNFNLQKTLCFEWRCVPGWTLSVSAEFYTDDWCDVALLIYRRFPDAKSQTAMDHEVKVALWGPDPDYWPTGRGYEGPVPVIVEDKPKPNPQAEMFAEFCQPETSNAPVDPEPREVTEAPTSSLEPYFIYDRPSAGDLQRRRRA